ncbi:MAG: hypothetical protein HQ582_30135 [Planctomycetes bacterium]|nr:hypothetical protein [Planctomycetota bacterium]
MNRTTLLHTLVAAAIGVSTLVGLQASAAEPVGHDLWLISTRQAPYTKPVGGEDRIHYWRLNADSQWDAADLESFLADDDPNVPTSVFIHGNRSSHQWAVRMGWGVYHHLKGEAGERPFRFVIWSWPADQISGVRQDVQVKAARSDVQAYYLAHVLRQVNPDVPVSLTGYSFGARTITGALQLLAGGEFAGRSLPEGTAPVQRTPIRAVLVAAAMANYWLLPGKTNGLALSQAERILVTRNRNDPVLQWYDRMYGRGGPAALGYTGPASPSRLGADQEKVETLVLDRSVGSNHDWAGYLRASPLRGRLAWYAFLEPADSEAAVEATAQPEATEATAEQPAAGS